MRKRTGKRQSVKKKAKEEKKEKQADSGRRLIESDSASSSPVGEVCFSTAL